MKFTKKRISHGKEGVAPKRISVAISKKIYFLILWIIFGYILYIFFLNYTVIRGNGIIKNDIYTFRAKEDVMISEINIKEDQYIKKNEYLYKIKFLNKYYNPLLSNIKDKIKIKNDLMEIKIQIYKTKEELKNIENTDIIYSLDLYSRNDLLKKKEKYNQLNINLKVLQKKYKYFKSILKKIIKNKIKNNKYIIKKEFAKINGRIIDLRIKNYNFIKKNGILFKEITDRPGYIEGFFEKSKIKNIFIGKKVKIIFPNDIETNGHIIRMKSSFIDGREKLSESYIPNSRSLKVFIELDDKKYDKLLKKYNDLNVKLELKK